MQETFTTEPLALLPIEILKTEPADKQICPHFQPIILWTVPGLVQRSLPLEQQYTQTQLNMASNQSFIMVGK